VSSYDGGGNRVRANAQTPTAEADRYRIQAVVLRLKALRVERGLSQRDVSAAMGTAQSAVCDLEALTNNDVQVGTLMRYARAVGTRLSIDVEA
jgi:predicted XRE-type DNA-binding protein